jgi:glycosyltransferase involved in cell wall biosynthesis
LKIALLSGSVYPCPPRGYGSEVATFTLARALCAACHEVHLFGPGGSRHPGPGGHLHYTRGSYGTPDLVADADPWTWYRDVLRACDVVHDLSPTCRTIEELFLDDPNAPYLYTRNGIDVNRPRFGRRNTVVLSQAARDCALRGISAWAGTKYAGGPLDAACGTVPAADVVHYGIPLEPGDEFGYYPGGDVEDYLLYVGRPHPAKGVGRIIELARQMPEQHFVLAWRAAAADHEVFGAEYRKQAEGLPNVHFADLPAVGHMEAKRRLYQRARALLNPVHYIEAFGLVNIEALACGTPVITTDKGAAPEIILPGQTGYLVPPEEDEFDLLRHAVEYIGQIDRSACRRDAEERWSVRRMAEDYLRLYDRVAAGDQLAHADRFGWQRWCVEQTTGLVLNAGCKEDPAGLKATHGARVVNLDRHDFDEDPLKHRGERVPIPVDVRHDLLQFPWPFADGMFEMVVLAEVLEDLPADQGRVLREARRVARRLCVTCPTDTTERDTHHLTTVTEETLRGWLEQSGWRVVEWRRATYVLDHGRAMLPGNFVLAEAVQ